MENKELVQSEIQKLTDELNRHNYNYYILDQPTISDFDFDMIEVRHFAAGRNKVSEMARDARLALDRVSEGTYNTIEVVSASFETQFSDVEEMEDSVQHVKEQVYKFITRR